MVCKWYVDQLLWDDIAYGIIWFWMILRKLVIGYGLIWMISLASSHIIWFNYIWLDYVVFKTNYMISSRDHGWRYIRYEWKFKYMYDLFDEHHITEIMVLWLQLTQVNMKHITNHHYQLQWLHKIAGSSSHCLIFDHYDMLLTC